MRINLTIKLGILFALTVFQKPVFGQRYLSKVFDSVLVHSDLPFGSAISYKGDTQSLFLELYEPFGDTVSKRPLVVLAHGGSFAQGSRKASDITTLCKELCKRGYVTASIDYRLGADILSGKPLEQEYQQAVWRATQDMRASVRYFNKGIQSGNLYKLNSNEIYVGGISAGGVMGLQLSFLDQATEIANTLIDTNLVGGIEGNSGNAGYDWRAKGVVSLCGGIGNTNWMNNNLPVSLCLMHGNQDATVPYKTAYYQFFGTDVTIVRGSFSLDSAAMKKGMNTRLHTFDGAGHVPFTGSTATHLAYMDTTLNYVSRYLYKQVTGLTPIGIKEEKQPLLFTVFPNPAERNLHISFDDNKLKQMVLMDMQGRVQLNLQTTQSDVFIELTTQEPGTYFLQVVADGLSQTKKIILQ